MLGQGMVRMKALILSDSHGWTRQLNDIIQRHQDEIDVIFHCGDSELATSASELAGVDTVRGNCDFLGEFPEYIVKDVNGIRFFVCHGHLLNVKMTEMNLIYKAKENDAAIACFGHTHVPVAVMEDNLLIVNPGSIRQPRNYPRGTYAIIETNKTQVKVDFYSVNGEHEKNLSKIFS